MTHNYGEGVGSFTLEGLTPLPTITLPEAGELGVRVQVADGPPALGRAAVRTGDGAPVTSANPAALVFVATYDGSTVFQDSWSTDPPTALPPGQLEALLERLAYGAHVGDLVEAVVPMSVVGRTDEGAALAVVQFLGQ